MLSVAAHLATLLLVPPLMFGIINRVKARFAGRRGPPLLQPYYDLWRLVQKGAVYSRTSTWIFRAGPVVGLASIAAAGLLLPLALPQAPLGFAGDVILFAYLLGLGRFFTVAAALDVGSSFEGMGASREAAFGALAEPALFLSLAILCVPARTLSFGEAFTALPTAGWYPLHPALFIAGCVVFVVLLTENSRIPVDDPNTHLELTMIHEVMVLDHSGPDFAFILYGAGMKLLVGSALLVRMLVPGAGDGSALGVALFFLGLIGVAVAVGVVESVMARLRLMRVPQFLVAASVLGLIGLAVTFQRGLP